MKIGELRQRPKGELEKLLKEKRELMRTLRFGLSSGKVKNIREIREIKKDIARILTILRITNQYESTNKSDKKK